MLGVSACCEPWIRCDMSLCSTASPTRSTRGKLKRGQPFHRSAAADRLPRLTVAIADTAQELLGRISLYGFGLIAPL